MATCAVDRAWADAIAAVYPHEYNRIYNAVCAHPEPETLAKLLLDLANHSSAPPPNHLTTSNTKKRKLDDGIPSDAASASITQTNGHTNHAIVQPSISFECNDISFQVPSRKKLKLQLVSDADDKNKKEIRLLRAPTNELEYTLPVEQIDEVFCLPVPEKQQRQWNFCLFPPLDATRADGTPCEQVVFTMNETPAVGASNVGGEGDTYVSITEAELNTLLRQHSKRVIRPLEAEFASSIPQSHRKGEKAYHVKAHRGSKDGFLFFLSKGVVFGFKKPLAFFPFACIDAISYTSVLQRTFNLVISTTSSSDGADVKETEFSMLDQADFAGIDDYVKRHGLNDASMAADRRAKAYNVNKVKKELDENGDDAGDREDAGEEQSELQKAEQQLQDDEDEEEEDYEASGGESDGEGEDSDGDDDDDGDGEPHDDVGDEDEDDADADADE